MKDCCKKAIQEYTKDDILFTLERESDNSLDFREVNEDTVILSNEYTDSTFCPTCQKYIYMDIEIKITVEGDD